MAIKDAMKKLEENEKGSQEDTYEPPKIFLILSALMVVISVLAYIFEDVLFEVTYSSNVFLITLIVPIFLALFFLFCYRSKRLVMIIMGRRAELGELKDKGASVTYDVFGGSGGVEEKLMQSRRKKSRHTRKQYAQTTKSIVPDKEQVTSEESDNK